MSLVGSQHSADTAQIQRRLLKRNVLWDSQAPSVQTAAVFENERYMPLIGWSANNLMPTDRRHFSGPNGSDTTSFPNVPLEPGTPREVHLQFHLALQVIEVWLCIHVCAYNCEVCTPSTCLVLLLGSIKMVYESLCFATCFRNTSNAFGDDAGWQWEGAWEVETVGNTDAGGWAYSLNWPLMRYPPDSVRVQTSLIFLYCLFVAV